ncbi:MAG TPA: hypothetical protein VF818_05320 [Ktedonobacterales bacterium]
MGSGQPDLPALPGWPRDHPKETASNHDAHEETQVAPVPWAGLRATTSPRAHTPTLATQPLAAAREPTLTQQIRNVQPPDVARQAIGELGVLAHELDALPEALAEAGLARSHASAYRAALWDYLDLCHTAWDAVAVEQLERVGAEPDYRQAAVGIARSITKLKQECDQASALENLNNPPRTPLLWRRRTRLIHWGMVLWQSGLSPVPDPLRMGRSLFTLRGYIGLASAGGLELALLDIIISATLGLTGLLTLGACLLLGSAIGAGAMALIASYTMLALAGVFSLMLALLLTNTRALPLGLLMGAFVFAPTRSPCLGSDGSRVVGGLLRAWWLLIGCVAAVALPVALTIGAASLAASQPLPMPSNALQAISLAGGILTVAAALPAGVGLSAVLLFTVPFALTAQTHLVRELGGNTHWVPAARRYALPPSLVIVVYVTGLLLAGAWAVGTSLHWEHIGLLRVSFSVIQGTLTVRGLVFMLVLALPYLALLDLPYRIGIRRWRTQRLVDLATRRAELEAQVRRLATQAANDDVLRAMQYDLVLLQFYRAQIDEARATASAPFRLEGRVLALLVAIASALALDGASSLAIRFLAQPR